MAGKEGDVFQFASPLCHERIIERTTPALRYDGGDVVAWQRRLRRKLRRLMGVPTGKCPLNVRRLWRKETELGVIEKIVFTAEPGADVPAYVCVPAGAEPPYPWFICLQGHSTGMHVSVALDFETESRTIPVEGDRDLAIGCMKRGIAALCVEQRGFGHRSVGAPWQVISHYKSRRDCVNAGMRPLMLGRTLLGERCFDVDRAIDYLKTRGDVDFRRLGVVGNSAGGQTSLYAAAVYPRIKLAMPSCCFRTFRSHMRKQKTCIDTIIPGIYLYAEKADVAGLIAPRPLVIVAGEGDEVSPMPAVREAYADLERIYRAAGAEDRLHLVVGQHGHRFYADLAWPPMMAEMARCG